MKLLRHRWLRWSLVVLVLGCGVLAWTRAKLRQSKHGEIREAFILLQTGGYTNEAKVLYDYLLLRLHKLPNKSLIEDWQRTVMLVDPSANLPDNLIWRYHWTVRREMEKRAERSIQRARQLAEEVKQALATTERTNRPPASP